MVQGLAIPYFARVCIGCWLVGQIVTDMGTEGCKAGSSWGGKYAEEDKRKT